MRKSLITAAALSAVALNAPAQAETGDVLVKLRGSYHKRLDDFSLTLPGSPQPVTVSAEDTAGAEASFTMFLAKKMALELSIGAAGYQVQDPLDRKLVSANMLMSTATIQYHPAPESKLIRPYVGVGLTHINLYGEDAQPTLIDPSASSSVSYKARLTSGFAPIGQIGSDVAISKSVYLNLDVKYTMRKTEILLESETFTTDSRNVASVIAAAGVGFRF